MRAFVVAIVVLAFAGFRSSGRQEGREDRRQELIGKWEPAEELKGAKVVIEFFAEKNKVTIRTQLATKSNA